MILFDDLSSGDPFFFGINTSNMPSLYCALILDTSDKIFDGKENDL